MPDINKKEKPAEQEQVNQPVTPEQAPGQVEVAPTPEIAKPEQPAEIKEIETEKEMAPATAPTSSANQARQGKTEIVSQIENVLAEDLEDVYFQMSPQKQAEFKKTGEETASNIAKLLNETKVKVRKILNLVTKWLKMVPGINKFFLEQEAKIKTDKLLELKEKTQISSDNENKNKI